MHRLGDVVDVRLVEAAPVAGALRFELLSEGHAPSRGHRREPARGGFKAQGKSQPGRSPRKKDRKPGKARSGKAKKGKSWKP
jgi:ribonuclease R